ncbi:Beta-lactamase [compost metagenome]
MHDSGTRLPPSHADRYAEPLPSDAPGPVLIDSREAMQFESGGACLWTTAEDYLRFAVALLNGGVLSGGRVLARTTVARMVSNQLEPGIDNRIAGTDPTRAGYGFGLGVAVALPGTIGPIVSPPGSFTWPSGSGTNWWADPSEGLAVSFMALTPGPSRWRYRQLVNALVYPALES